MAGVNIQNYNRVYAKNEDFIQTWHISEGLCDAILEYFDKNKEHHSPGATIYIGVGGTVNKDVKESFDISINPHFMEQPFLDYRIELQKCLDDYIKTYPHINELNRFDITENYNIQRYPIGGGFKIEHSEKDGGLNLTAKRNLVFMTYLNDVEDGGTKFVYQNRIVKAQKGKTVIFPADWTHTHVGQISQTSEKTIVTGWYSYLW